MISTAVIIHLLTHEVPLLVIAGLSFWFGKKAVFKYVRKHDPVVQELRELLKELATFRHSMAGV